jgi:hypothetical protein
MKDPLKLPVLYEPVKELNEDVVTKEPVLIGDDEPVASKYVILLPESFVNNLPIKSTDINIDPDDGAATDPEFTCF